MKKSIYLIVAVLVFLSLQSCGDNIDTQEFHYSSAEYETLTQRLNLPTETFEYNIPTSFSGSFPSNNGGNIYHKATLGRVLFYDKMLSVDETVSCASCHHQENAFAENRQVSEGINNLEGTRNSLPLGNTIGFVRYYGTDLSTPSGSFAWDESKKTINEQAKAAILNPVEMGHNMSELVDKLKEQDYYKILFKKVYGNEGVTEANMLDAITEFINSMTSKESKFDEGAKTASAYTNFNNFSASENRGKKLFGDNCGSCHDVNHNSILRSFANNGLDMVYEDKGMGELSPDPSYDGLFKVPSLRNISLTGPYMHDGRFATLMDVVNHYSDGIKNHKNLNSQLRSGNSAKAFNFTDVDKNDLVNYLNTLTDNKFIKAQKFSNPFK
ncbi:MAG: cytochrome c peroxidase [Saprospiraceae bacterium]